MAIAEDDGSHPVDFAAHHTRVVCFFHNTKTSPDKCCERFFCCHSRQGVCVHVWQRIPFTTLCKFVTLLFCRSCNRFCYIWIGAIIIMTSGILGPPILKLSRVASQTRQVCMVSTFPVASFKRSFLFDPDTILGTRTDTCLFFSCFVVSTASKDQGTSTGFLKPRVLASR